MMRRPRMVRRPRITLPVHYVIFATFFPCFTRIRVSMLLFHALLVIGVLRL